MTKTIEQKGWPTGRIVVWASIALILAAFIRYVLPSLMFAILMLSSGVATEQLERIESQDPFAQAVLVRTSPGLEPPGLHCRTERTEAKGFKGRPVMEGTEMQDLKLTWPAPKTLRSHSSGCIGSHFRIIGLPSIRTDALTSTSGLWVGQSGIMNGMTKTIEQKGWPTGRIVVWASIGADTRRVHIRYVLPSLMFAIFDALERRRDRATRTNRIAGSVRPSGPRSNVAGA